MRDGRVVAVKKLYLPDLGRIPHVLEDLIDEARIAMYGVFLFKAGSNVAVMIMLSMQVLHQQVCRSVHWSSHFLDCRNEDSGSRARIRIYG